MKEIIIKGTVPINLKKRWQNGVRPNFLSVVLKEVTQVDNPDQVAKRYQQIVQKEFGHAPIRQKSARIVCEHGTLSVADRGQEGRSHL